MQFPTRFLAQTCEVGVYTISLYFVCTRRRYRPQHSDELSGLLKEHGQKRYQQMPGGGNLLYVRRRWIFASPESCFIGRVSALPGLHIMYATGIYDCCALAFNYPHGCKCAPNYQLASITLGVLDPTWTAIVGFFSVLQQSAALYDDSFKLVMEGHLCLMTGRPLSITNALRLTAATSAYGAKALGSARVQYVPVPSSQPLSPNFQRRPGICSRRLANELSGKPENVV